MGDSRRRGLEAKAPHYSICVPSQRLPTYYPVFPRATGSLPNSTHFQENDSHLLISTVDGLNNTIFVCEAINALGSGQGQVTILVKGEQSSDKEGRYRRMAP